MKKRGKYEKIPQAQAKVRAEKTILHTYVTSLLSLVLCVTMFFGTSFAWFTSEVTNTENEIYIGTLDVELEKKLADGTWASLSELDNGSNKTNLFDKNIRWEPGYTVLETIKIVNEGDLAFNYVLNFIETPATTEENGAATQSEETEKLDIKTVAENFDVWVYDHVKNGDAPTLSSYADITAADSKWTNAGSLDALLGGDFVLNGTMAEADVRYENVGTSPTNPRTTDGKATEHTYTIALHMKEETNDPALMGYKISLNVKLIAYQMASEQDGFGENSNYDVLVPVNSAEELLKVNGSNVVLTGTIDLGGKAGNYLALTEDTTITGGTIKGAGWSGELNYAVNATAGNIVFDGVTFDTTDWTTEGTANWGISVNVSGTANVTFKNCTFKGTQCSIYQSGADSAITLENCKFDTTSVAIQCEIYSGDFSLGQDLIVKNCDFTGVADVLHIYDHDKDPSSDAIVQYLRENDNTFTGTCKQTCK